MESDGLSSSSLHGQDACHPPEVFRTPLSLFKKFIVWGDGEYVICFFLASPELV
jgi:hypothetical protein